MECVRMPVASSRVKAFGRASMASSGTDRRLHPRGRPRCHPGPQSEERKSNLTAGAWSQSPATDRLSPPGWSNISRICRTAPASPGSGRSAGPRFLRSTSPCLSRYSPTSRRPGCNRLAPCHARAYAPVPVVACRVQSVTAADPTRTKADGGRRMATASDDSSRRRLTSRSVGVRA